jgi:hypothetical protein
MALHGPICVNGKDIGNWYAQREMGVLDPQADDVVTYVCVVHQEATLEGNPAINWAGTLDHRFGDGALALAAKVLTTASAITRSEVRR